MGAFCLIVSCPLGGERSEPFLCYAKFRNGWKVRAKVICFPAYAITTLHQSDAGGQINENN
jgi:hypothetical protein